MAFHFIAASIHLRPEGRAVTAREVSKPKMKICFLSSQVSVPLPLYILSLKCQSLKGLTVLHIKVGQLKAGGGGQQICIDSRRYIPTTSEKS
jgi:predicted benzoate:H+ symporter BenE